MKYPSTFHVESIVFPVLVVSICLLAGYAAAHYSTSRIFYIIIGFAIFIVAFIHTEIALYLLVFSMLLSPEFGMGEIKGGATLGRGATLRMDDLLLVIIGFSWLAKNAINKELGLFLKTPLNKPILYYVLACIVSTGLGIMVGRIYVKTGFFYVLKYIEYFIVFFMVANYLENMAQARRFVFCLLLTCFITAMIGMMQIPGGGRVSAPFEGETGEPNTYGGYLIFIGAIAGGLWIKVRDAGPRRSLVILMIAIFIPLLYTQSRSSYLSAVPILFILALLMKRKAISVGIVVLTLLLAPLFLPQQIKNRILYTFYQREHPGQHVTVGRVRLDTSTSARLISWKEAVRDWAARPLFGYGVTGYRFVDAQFPRVLVETGAVGLTAFLFLLYSLFKLAAATLESVTTPYGSGIAAGFLAGYAGLLFHSIGANTFIIVRIMEPFWFMAGVIAVLPSLERKEDGAEKYCENPSNGAMASTILHT